MIYTVTEKTEHALRSVDYLFKGMELSTFEKIVVLHSLYAGVMTGLDEDSVRRALGALREAVQANWNQQQKGNGK